jgi:PEGA domain-containing protein
MTRLRTLAVLALVLVGCTCTEDPPAATVIAPPPQAAPSAPQIYEVTIASTPTSAKVTLGGAELGTTPYLIKFKTQTSLMVEADGYIAHEVTVGPDSEPTVVVTLTPKEGEPSTPAIVAAAPTVARTSTSSGSKSSSAGSSTPTAAAKPTAPAPAPKSSLPYDNVAEAKGDYQSGKIDRDAYDQAVRKLKVRRNAKILEIRDLYQRGLIDKGEYQQRKRVIDNEYKGV